MPHLYYQQRERYCSNYAQRHGAGPVDNKIHYLIVGIKRIAMQIELLLSNTIVAGILMTVRMPKIDWSIME